MDENRLDENRLDEKWVYPITRTAVLGIIWAQLRATLKPLRLLHYFILLRALRDALIQDPIIPRAQSSGRIPFPTLNQIVGFIL